MRFWLIVFTIIFTAYFSIQRYLHPHLNHNSTIDRISHPLDTRLRYRIGEIDPRFHMSREHLALLAQQGADIWHQGTMKGLFVYDPHAKLAINLIYDERQAESTARQQELNILENTQQYQNNERLNIEKLRAELDQSNREINIYKVNYESKVSQYNQFVQSINQSNQSLHPSTQAQLEQLKNQLDTERINLNQKLALHNQKVNQLNQLVDALNSNTQQFNHSVDQFNARFQPRQFDKGMFNGESINIYEFQSDADLRVTIAHEFGHALGLLHNTDPKALMYPIMKEQDLQNFRLTAADLAMLNSR
ncbi:matrixin family metalloprotease [Acinetobacter piscicola]|uniref:matrixin family metalloprotease n=1 Tax=Acinetobacter piscicola TaxID=2006115 RepID=UPI0010210676|nr:matrixin family metalloprotease [Acinetobacter piscicola]RYL22899.1 matrixin family metalloprotease [Acinetobacter piscicola]